MTPNRDKYQYPNQVSVIDFRKDNVPDSIAHLFYEELRKWDPSIKGIPARHLPSFQEGLLWQMYDQAMEIYYKKK